MKNSILITFCFTAACTSLSAQTLQYKNYPINHTGYFALFPADPGKAEVSISDNELEVFSSEMEYSDMRFGVILVLLEDKFIYSDRETLESLLISYMEFQKLSYDITSSIGYIKGQAHPAKPSATGVLDFWEDERGAQWAVKGWIANDALAFVYVNSRDPLAMQVPYAFLDGFGFKKALRKEESIRALSKTSSLK